MKKRLIRVGEERKQRRRKRRLFPELMAAVAAMRAHRLRRIVLKSRTITVEGR
jgi:hypothetical protein